MERKDILQALADVKTAAKERKFTQSVDLIINLKGLNMKKEDERVLSFVNLPHNRGKKIRVTALIGQELSTKAKEVCDHVVLQDDFKSYDKKKIKRLADMTDVFIAQATIMPKVAATFGRVLGPRGAMPNPKAGAVVPPTAELKPVVERMQKVVKVEAKSEQVIKASVGNVSMKDDEVADNVLAIYQNIINSLPQEKNNIKNVMLKLTMGKPVLVGQKVKKGEEAKVEEKPAEEKPVEKPKATVKKTVKKAAKKTAQEAKK